MKDYFKISTPRNQEEKMEKYSKYMKRHFTEGKSWMVIKHKKKWSILLVIKGNASTDHSEKVCNVHSVGKEVRRLMILCVGKDGNSMAILIHCWWEKIYHYLVKVTIYMDYYLQFHSWVLSIVSYTHTHTHTPEDMYLSRIMLYNKMPDTTSISINKRKNKFWDIHTNGTSHSHKWLLKTMWMNLRNALLS